MDPKVLHVDNQSGDSMCGVSGFGWNSHFQLWLECVNEVITMYQMSTYRLPSIYIARIISDSYAYRTAWDWDTYSSLTGILTHH